MPANAGRADRCSSCCQEGSCSQVAAGLGRCLTDPADTPTTGGEYALCATAQGPWQRCFQASLTKAASQQEHPLLRLQLPMRAKDACCQEECKQQLVLLKQRPAAARAHVLIRVKSSTLLRGLFWPVAQRCRQWVGMIAHLQTFLYKLAVKWLCMASRRCGMLSGLLA